MFVVEKLYHVIFTWPSWRQFRASKRMLQRSRQMIIFPANVSQFLPSHQRCVYFGAIVMKHSTVLAHQFWIVFFNCLYRPHQLPAINVCYSFNSTKYRLPCPPFWISCRWCISFSLSFLIKITSSRYFRKWSIFHHLKMVPLCLLLFPRFFFYLIYKAREVFSFFENKNDFKGRFQTP